MTEFVERYQPPQSMQRTLYRPKLSPNEAPRLWWRYAIRSIVLQLRFINRNVKKDESEVENEVLQEIRHEAQMLYLKETPLGLRIMTMEGLRGEVEFLRNENDILKNMLEAAYSSISDMQSRIDALENSRVVTETVSLSLPAEVNSETDDVQLETIELKDSIENISYHDEFQPLDEDGDPMPLSSIEELLDKAVLKQQVDNTQAPSISTVACDGDESGHPNQEHVSRAATPHEPVSSVESVDGTLSVNAPPPQPIKKRISYHAQLQQHVQRMNRANIIRAAAAAAAQMSSVHPDHYREATGSMIDDAIVPESSINQESSSLVQEYLSRQKKINNQEILKKQQRSKQISRAYNTAPFVLRPATRSPSRNSRKKKTRSKSRSRSRHSASRSRKRKETENDKTDERSYSPSNNAVLTDEQTQSAPKANVDQTPFSTTDNGSASTENMDQTNSMNKSVDFFIEQNQSKNNNKKSPVRLPIITDGMNEVEKVAVSIIRKVRAGNSKKVHSPDVNKKLSPTELMLLKSPFAQSIIPAKKSKNHHVQQHIKSPVPPSSKRPAPIGSNPNHTMPHPSPRAKHIVVATATTSTSEVSPSASIHDVSPHSIEEEHDQVSAVNETTAAMDKSLLSVEIDAPYELDNEPTVEVPAPAAAESIDISNMASGLEIVGNKVHVNASSIDAAEAEEEDEVFLVHNSESINTDLVVQIKESEVVDTPSTSQNQLVLRIDDMSIDTVASDGGSDIVSNNRQGDIEVSVD